MSSYNCKVKIKATGEIKELKKGDRLWVKTLGTKELKKGDRLWVKTLGTWELMTYKGNGIAQSRMSSFAHLLEDGEWKFIRHSYWYTFKQLFFPPKP